MGIRQDEILRQAQDDKGILILYQIVLLVKIEKNFATTFLSCHLSPVISTEVERSLHGAELNSI